MQSLWARKPLERLADEAEGSLARRLGAVHLVALGVGAIVGAGIFVLTGQAAAQYAGPAIVLSFLLAAVAAAFAGLCYAEFAALIPISGSAYSYTYATMGELLAWIIGWDLMLEYLFGGAVVAVGWSGYATDLLKDFGIALPAALASPPMSGGLVNLPAALIVALLTGLLVRGSRESAGANNLIVAAKLLVILAFVGFGWAHVDPANWRPFVPTEFGWPGVVRGAGVVFLAYIGFDAVSTASQEARNPQRDMPIGILGALAISTVLYVLVAGVLTGLVSYPRLDVADPIAVGIDAAGPTLAWLRLPLKLGALAGLTSGMLVMLYGQTRILYTMSRDGLLPPLFSQVHPTFRTPHLSTLTVGGAAALAAGLLPIDVLAEMVSIGTLLAFTLVSAGVLILRRREPDRPRPFRVPLVPLVPLLGITTSLALMISLPAGSWLRLLVWMALGLVVYFTYGRKRSGLRT